MSVIGLFYGIGWCCVIGIENWDVLLTTKGRFLLYWKPYILMIPCAILISALQDNA